MKIVIIGAGSYVFAPTILADLIDKHRFSPATLFFVDPDLEAARLMAALARRMAEDTGCRVIADAFTDRRAALASADFVILCASIQGTKRWRMDCEILSASGLENQVRECGGLGGLIHALRSCTLALDVCRDMRATCPDAWLLDATNPMPRVVTAAAKYGAIRTLGFCNIAYGGPCDYDNIARLAGRPAKDLKVTTAGLNHFAWLVSVKERATGKDLSRTVEENVLRRADLGGDDAVLASWLKEWGALGVSSIEHMSEYLSPRPKSAVRAHAPFHGDADERRLRREALEAAASGRVEWRPVVYDSPSWEHPADVAVALYTGATANVDILNYQNTGCLPQLPTGAIVEAPARIENGLVLPSAPITLPPKVAALCGRISHVHELVARASASGDRQLLYEAVEADPAIPDKDKLAALRALVPLLSAHEDILPQFGSAVLK